MYLTKNELEQLKLKKPYVPQKGQKRPADEIEKHREHIVKRREVDGATWSQIGKEVGYPDHVVLNWYTNWYTQQ